MTCSDGCRCGDCGNEFHAEETNGELERLRAEVGQLKADLDKVVTWGPSDAGSIVFAELRQATEYAARLEEALRPFVGSGRPDYCLCCSTDEYLNAAIRVLAEGRLLGEAYRVVDLTGLSTDDSAMKRLREAWAVEERSHERHVDGAQGAPHCVHVLDRGLPLCGFSRDLPKDWPDGHVWVRANDRSKVKVRNRCRTCFGAADQQEAIAP